MNILASFKCKRLALLLIRDFYSQYKTYLIAFAAIFSLLFIINLASITGANSWSFNLVFYPFTLFIGGFIFTSLSCAELSTRKGRIFYTTIPASNFEKFISKLLITGPGYVLVSIILSLETDD